ncbi:MAG: HigA family addiction module antidote protein [Deltaproteobacteria bacterium]|nr:HigA family addiction module antidote protein [Deltaproteobacteria bacterium]
MTTEATAIYSDLAIPPGEYLEEVIKELGMTKDELARRMNRPASKLSPIFKGDKAITPDTAIQLEKVLGVPAHVWTGLESEYRLTMARQKEKKGREQLKDELNLVTKYCYNDLARLELVPKHTKLVEKVLALQRYFGVATLSAIPELKQYQPTFRCKGTEKRKPSPHAVSSWLRIGELKAIQTTCAPFSTISLTSLLPQLRHMTRLSPEEFLRDLHKKLAEAGIVFVLVPHLPKTYVHGATFGVGKNKAVLMMTMRGKWADIFWFSLFHELGHILLHNYQMIFIESEDINPDFLTQETEADHFAADTLIPPEEYGKFLSGGSFYPESIQQFADKIGIDAGIVVGRLQHEGHIQVSWHNGLRHRYEWKGHSH